MIRLQQKKKNWIKLIVFVCIAWGAFASSYQPSITFPKELRLMTGAQMPLHVPLPALATATVSNPEVVELKGEGMSQIGPYLKRPMTMLSKHRGESDLTFHLFGKVPIKSVHVSVLPEIRVVPGGQSIGVKLKSQGVLVVGHHHLKKEEQGREKSPVFVGDYILSINGGKVRGVQDVARTIQEAGQQKQTVTLEVLRKGKKKDVVVKPQYDDSEGIYRIGLYIRDSAAGVGTLTFFDPKNEVYGGLGHVIADIDTGEPIKVGGGHVVRSNVTSIERGTSGEPGEKRAIFMQENHVLGSIVRNTSFGIFGVMKHSPDGGQYKEPIPVGLAEQVKEGPAEILTVIEGQKVERFTIEILHVTDQKFPATKGMIIRITDPKLLEKTGGIVQGMSGSPIIQDGKLIGAVTHVFVNDPTSGYATFIEWMLRDAGSFPQTAGLQPAPLFSL
ncbi:SpoIVB peptidase [Mechercharimyces sp. CAU 1602]|uniref:SpoIVB peptidase n=1 Tax=Mechercharimyces sp. CAU 1602 TaxID=2973933 RepID=UPI002163C925|nr:SpoIVB peptidase [Mechercharimyces sp. CAU 1602]MCS1350796.1 SpoIVB peptidase [Mechercharimyces sp. CAU 1602]